MSFCTHTWRRGSANPYVITVPQPTSEADIADFNLRDRLWRPLNAGRQAGQLRREPLHLLGSGLRLRQVRVTRGPRPACLPAGRPLPDSAAPHPVCQFTSAHFGDPLEHAHEAVPLAHADHAVEIALMHTRAPRE